MPADVEQALVDRGHDADEARMAVWDAFGLISGTYVDPERATEADEPVDLTGCVRDFAVPGPTDLTGCVRDFAVPGPTDAA